VIERFGKSDSQGRSRVCGRRENLPNDVPVLMRYGRFLEPIANRVLPKMYLRDQHQAMTTLKGVAMKFIAAATVCK